MDSIVDSVDSTALALHGLYGWPCRLFGELCGIYGAWASWTLWMAFLNSKTLAFYELYVWPVDSMVDFVDSMVDFVDSMVNSVEFKGLGFMDSTALSARTLRRFCWLKDQKDIYSNTYLTKNAFGCS
jgi:hypothetical protein